MNLLVRCRCEQWVLDELSPNQTFYNLDCSICSRSTLWSFEHVGKRPTCQTTVTADNVFWNHRVYTEDSVTCVKRQGAIVDGQYTWYVEPTGRYIREIHGLMATEDHFGDLEHLGEYEYGRCVRGIWMHQASGFLYYRSQNSDLRYERGIISGKRYHGLLDPDTEVATPRRFATIRDRLLRKFPHRSIRNRERIRWYWVAEDASGMSSSDSSQSGH